MDAPSPCAARLIESVVCLKVSSAKEMFGRCTVECELIINCELNYSLVGVSDSSIVYPNNCRSSLVLRQAFNNNNAK